MHRSAWTEEPLPFQGSGIITPSVRKYLSSKWIKEDVSRCILVLDTSLFIHFDDKYFRTEGVPSHTDITLLLHAIQTNIANFCFILQSKSNYGDCEEDIVLVLMNTNIISEKI